MARPKKNNADYFSHDNNMRDDPKIKYIRSLFGLPCYAIYCMLLEYLCYSDGLKIERNDHHKKLLCGDFCISKELLDQYIDAMIDVELIILQDGHIYSGGLNHRLQGVFDKRNHAKDKFLLQKQTETPISVTESTQSKVKESKEYNIDSTKTQSIKYILSDGELIEERGLDILEEFVNYWSEPNKAGKEKRQLERTWDTNLRLKKWKKNKDTNFGTKQIIDYEIVDNYHIAYLGGKLEDVKQYFKNKYPTDRQNKYRQAKEKYRNSDLFIKAVK